jgi:hypothetical protein
VGVPLATAFVQVRADTRTVRADTEREFGRAGDAAGKSFGDNFSRSADGRLRDQRGRFAKDMGSTGAAAGAAASRALLGEFGKVFTALPPPMKTALIGGAASALPVVSASVSAAITAGAAVGAVGIGAAIVSKRPDVQRAAQGMMTSVWSSVQTDATPMVRPVLHGIAMIERRADNLRPTFQRIFADAGRYAPTLFGAVDRSVDVLVRGFADIVARGGPVVDVLGEKLPQSAAALAGAMRMATDEVSGNAQALGAVFTVLNFSIQTLGTTMKALSLVSKYTMGGQLALLNALGGNDNATQNGTKTLQDYINQMNLAVSPTQTLAQDTRSLADAQRDAATAAQEQFGSITSLRQAIVDANAAAKDNNAGINGSSAAALKNREALASLARQTLATRDSTVALKGSGVEANAIMSQGYSAFIRSAVGMNMSRGAAASLARQLGLIPAAKSTKISTPGMTAAQIAAVDLKNKIGAIKDKRVTIDILQRLSTQGVRVAGVTGRGGFTAERWGGIVEHAQTGLIRLRQAGVFSAKNPARYAFAERETGGEAFIPRRGDPQRSAAILAEAASWYGMQISAAAGGAFPRAGGGSTATWSPPTVAAQQAGIHVHLHNHGVIGSQTELDRWLVASTTRLRRERRLP